MTFRPLCLGLCLAFSAVAFGELSLPDITTNSAAPPRIVIPEPERALAKSNAVSELPPPEVARPIRPLSNEKLSLLKGPVQDGDALTFTNGDVFGGALGKFEDGIMHWQLPAAKNLLRLRPVGIEGIELAAPVTPALPAPSGWLLFLNDGSLLRARTLTFDGERLAVELASAGRMTLPRDQLAEMRRVAPGLNELVSLDDAPVYTSPVAPGAVRAGFRARYRDVRLPENLLLEFAWPADEAAYAHLRLYAGPAEDLARAPSQVQFTLSRRGASLMLYSPNGSASAQLGSALTNVTGRSTWVALAHNRKHGDATLFLDGRAVQRASLLVPNALPESGLAATISHDGRMTPRYVIVSRGGENQSLPAPVSDKDTIALANFDAMTGRLESLTSNTVVFSSVAGRVELPLERMTQVTFARPAAGSANPDGALLGLAGGETLRGVLQRLDTNVAVVKSPALGTLTLPRTALHSVDVTYEQAAASGPVELLQDQEAGWFRGFGKLRMLSLMGRYGASHQPGSVRLMSNTQYHGDLVAIRDGLVFWQHPSTLEPMQLAIEQVQRIAPLPRRRAASPASRTSTVRLRNGNVITGVLETNAENCVVSTTYAGLLTVPGIAVALVTSNTSLPALIEQGPNAKWMDLFGRPVMLDNGVLWLDSGNRQCSRQANLPDRLRLDIEGTWSPGRVGVSARFFCDIPGEQRRPLSQYGVDFTEGAVAFSASAPSFTNAQLHTTVRCPQLLTNMNQRGQATFTIFAERSTGQIHAYVDDRPAGQWRAPAGMTPTGNSIQISANSNAGFALRNVSVSEWRELPPAPRTPVPPPPDGKRQPREALVALHNGDRLTLEELRWDASTLAGRHAHLGPVTINHAAVRSIEWPPAVQGINVSSPRSVRSR